METPASSLLLGLPNCSLPNDSNSYFDNGGQMAGQDPLVRYLLLFYSIVFLLVGVPADLLSMLLWCRRISSSQGSTALFLTVLCAVDTLVLVQGCLRHLAITVTCRDPRMQLGCSWPLFLYTWLSNTSVWIICLMCVERLVCVCWPFSMKSVCQLRNGAAALAVVASLLATCGGRQASNKIFVTVFAMAVCHLLFTAPVVVWYHGFSDLCDMDSLMCSRIELICQILERLNHLIHFFIFSFTSSLFMTDLKALLNRLPACRSAGNPRPAADRPQGKQQRQQQPTAATFELQETQQRLLPSSN